MHQCFHRNDLLLYVFGDVSKEYMRLLDLHALTCRKIRFFLWAACSLRDHLKRKLDHIRYRSLIGRLLPKE